MKDLKKEASAYTDKMMSELKKMYKGEFKSPMQLSKEEKSKFFKHMDTVWKSKKESKKEDKKEDAKSKIDAILVGSEHMSKQVKDYFMFVQDQLKQNYPKDNYKSPMQIKDKAEQKNFFSQVKKLWKKKKGEAKEASTVQEEFFKKFNTEQMTELASALEIAKGHGKIKNKVIHSQLLKALNGALDGSSEEKEIKE